MTIVVTHLAGTGFHHKSLIHLALHDGVSEDTVRELLRGKLGMARAEYDSLRVQLAELGALQDDNTTYRKGLSAEHPEWPLISFWPR